MYVAPHWLSRHTVGPQALFILELKVCTFLPTSPHPSPSFCSVSVNSTLCHFLTSLRFTLYVLRLLYICHVCTVQILHSGLLLHVSSQLCFHCCHGYGGSCWHLPNTPLTVGVGARVKVGKAMLHRVQRKIMGEETVSKQNI